MPLQRLRPDARMSQAVVWGGLVHLSGQVALEARDADAAEQARVVLRQIDDLLAEAGTGKDRLVSATIWLTDPADFAAVNAVWDAWLAPGAAPARATVGAALMLPGLRVEIAAVAAVGDG